MFLPSPNVLGPNMTALLCTATCGIPVPILILRSTSVAGRSPTALRLAALPILDLHVQLIPCEPPQLTTSNATTTCFLYLELSAK